MRETIAFALIGFIVLFVALLLLLWVRKRRKLHESIWGTKESPVRPRRPFSKQNESD